MDQQDQKKATQLSGVFDIFVYQDGDCDLSAQVQDLLDLATQYGNAKMVEFAELTRSDPDAPGRGSHYAFQKCSSLSADEKASAAQLLSGVFTDVDHELEYVENAMGRPNAYIHRVYYRTNRIRHVLAACLIHVEEDIVFVSFIGRQGRALSRENTGLESNILASLPKQLDGMGFTKFFLQLTQLFWSRRVPEETPVRPIAGLQIWLQVQRFSPALKTYLRLGFELAKVDNIKKTLPPGSTLRKKFPFSSHEGLRAMVLSGGTSAYYLPIQRRR
jgi:hypothetical protein